MLEQISHTTNGATEQRTIRRKTEYGVGTHYVELTFTNGCVYMQYFTISEAVDPELTA